VDDIDADLVKVTNAIESKLAEQGPQQGGAMHKFQRKARRRGVLSPSGRITRVAIAAAGAILVFGAGAAYLLTQAGSEALAATSQPLLTIGVIGLVVAAVVAMHLFLTNPDRGHGHGHDRRDDRPSEPVRGPDMDDIDAEFFRIVERDLLRDF
jgi:anti-sigma factor RsiW